MLFDTNRQRPERQEDLTRSDGDRPHARSRYAAILRNREQDQSDKIAARPHYAIERRKGEIKREIKRLADSIAKGMPIDHIHCVS